MAQAKIIIIRIRSIFLTSSFLRSSYITQLNCLFRDRTTVYDVLHKGVKYSEYVRGDFVLFCECSDLSSRKKIITKLL